MNKKWEEGRIRPVGDQFPSSRENNSIERGKVSPKLTSAATLGVCLCPLKSIVQCLFFVAWKKNNLSQSASNGGKRRLRISHESLYYTGFSSLDVVSSNCNPVFFFPWFLSQPSTQFSPCPIASWSPGGKFTFTVITPVHNCYVLPPQLNSFSLIWLGLLHNTHPLPPPQTPNLTGVIAF